MAKQQRYLVCLLLALVAGLAGGQDIPPAEDRKVVVVGNGRSVLGSGAGDIIDTYEHVVRFNIFKTKGYEQDVGSKTTDWVMAQIKTPKQHDPTELKDVKTVVVPFSLRPCKNQLKPCKKSEIDKKKMALGQQKMDKLREMVRNSPNVPPDAEVTVTIMPETTILYEKYKLFEKFPSSGLQIINYYVEHYRKVAIIGFDFEKGDHQHYWEQKLKNETCHNMGDEARIIREMEQEGVIYRLGKKADEAELKKSEYTPDCKIVCNGLGSCAKITGKTFQEYTTMGVRKRDKMTVDYWKKQIRKNGDKEFD